MSIKQSVFNEDINDVALCDFIPWNELKGKTVFITGGTGLIGTVIIKGMLLANKNRQLGLKIIALVRDIGKAKTRFSNELSEPLCFIKGCVEDLPKIDHDIDYIIHGASNTASRMFIEKPVETISTSVTGTENLLKLARSKQTKGFVFLSSMEVYGYPERGHKVKEEEIGALSPLNIRNSYPISKQLCEAMVCAYASEYKLNADIIRLTQTFGAGIRENDNRIFAYFVKCAKNKEDIVLKTKGETERSYLYTTDAATAILMVLLKGESGHSYNAANEETYCSIAEMAEIVAKDAGINVRYEIEDNKNKCYADTLYMDLDIYRLERFGWKPRRRMIKEMFERTIMGDV